MSTAADLEGRLEPGEALRYQAPVRGGGRVGVTDDRVLVVRPDGTTSVRLGAVAEVTVEAFDWFLGVLSAAVVGFGVLSLDRSVLGGLAFLAFGVLSLYVTYRRRGRVKIHVHDRRTAVTFSLDDTETFRSRLGAALDRYRDRRDQEAT